MNQNDRADDRRTQFARLIEYGVAPETAGRRVGVSRSVAQRWAALLRVGGVEKLASLNGAQQRYPFAFKLQVVRARLDGASEPAVLEAFGLRSSGTLTRWVRAFKNHGSAGLGGTDEEAAVVRALGNPQIKCSPTRVHSIETRRVFAEAVAAGNGYEAASKVAGIPFSTGWAWYQKCRSGGLLALTTVTAPTTYPAALKAAAARAVVDNGDTRAEVMARFTIRGHSTLQNWVQMYRVEGSAAFTDQPIAPRRRRAPAAGSARIARDNLALTEVIAHLDPTLPTSMKVQIVASLAGRYPVRPLLRALQLPASTYYYRRSRTPKRDRYEDARPLLREVFADAYNAYGYRRVRAQMRIQHGLPISGKTVRRLMREEGCTCVVRRRKRRHAGTKPTPANVFAPNILERNFAADAPGQKWVTDVTQFTVAGELLFLSPLIDLFNGEVISYRLATNQNMPMVLAMLEDALPLARRGVTILHSDRGWQYQHAGFRKVLQAQGITQSMSRRGNCYDNACAESFFSHFKQEFLRGRTFTSVDDFTHELDEWIHWFNTARVSAQRNWMSPSAYRLAAAA